MVQNDAECPFLPDGGDKDAQDLVQMRFEQRLRDGLEDGSVLGQHIGTFEKYTKVRLGCVLTSLAEENLADFEECFLKTKTLKGNSQKS